MARQRVEVETKDGKVQSLEMAHRVDYSIPMEDATSGKVPEFVNVSSKIQIVTVPNNPNAAIKVRIFGILKGAQWSNQFRAEKKGSFGMHPPFMPRQLGKDGEYDRKYLLTEEQMLKEIEDLSSIKPDGDNPIDQEIADRKVFRIEKLLAHAIITDDEGGRLMEDRAKVLQLGQKKMYELRALATKKRRQSGE